MPSGLLDISTLPATQVYTCQDGHQINLAEMIDNLLHKVVDLLSDLDVITSSTDSLGFVMLEPVVFRDDDGEAQNAKHLKFDDGGNVSAEDLMSTIIIAGGWGPDRDALIANAVRKLRPLIRAADEEHPSTLEMRLANNPDIFEAGVQSIDDDGNFPWGDFPWGGALQCGPAPLSLVGSISGLSEIEDDMVTRIILAMLARLIIEHEGLLSD